MAVVAAASAAGVGDIWFSEDAGASWHNTTKHSDAVKQQWSALASDETGNHIAAASSGGAGGICCDGDVWTN